MPVTHETGVRIPYTAFIYLKVGIFINPSKKRDNIKRKQRAKAFVNKIKKENDCFLCGEGDPLTLDFHHLDPKTKVDTISNMANDGYSLKTIQKEINKCIIVCCNCHRKLNEKQRKGVPLIKINFEIEQIIETIICEVEHK